MCLCACVHVCTHMTDQNLALTAVADHSIVPIGVTPPFLFLVCFCFIFRTVVVKRKSLPMLLCIVALIH